MHRRDADCCGMSRSVQRAAVRRGVLRSAQIIAECMKFVEHRGVRKAHGTLQNARSTVEYAKYSREAGSMWRATEWVEYAKYMECVERVGV